MKREKARKKEPIQDDGHQDMSEVKDILQTVVSSQKELAERMEELEDRTRNASAAAMLRMINLTYDTDDKHLPELTRIPIQAARPHALGMMLESLFDEDIQNGSTTLSKKLRMAYFRLMRSVGGIHLGRGVRIAEEQATAEAEKAEELELGSE